MDPQNGFDSDKTPIRESDTNLKFDKGFKNSFSTGKAAVIVRKTILAK